MNRNDVKSIFLEGKIKIITDNANEKRSATLLTDLFRL